MPLNPNLKPIPSLWYQLPPILSLNAQSLKNKIGLLRHEINDTDARIVAVTETWNIVPDDCQIPEFSLFYRARTRTDDGRGGVPLYVSNSLSPQLIEIPNPKQLEVLWVRCAPSHHPRGYAGIITCVVYYTPQVGLSSLSEDLKEHIIHTSDHLRAKYPSSKLLICGDFNNIAVDISTTFQAELNFTQVIDFPTYHHILARPSMPDRICSDLTPFYSKAVPRPHLGGSLHTAILWPPLPTLAPPPSPSPAPTGP